jgi:hypothetical protein
VLTDITPSANSNDIVEKIFFGTSKHSNKKYVKENMLHQTLLIVMSCLKICATFLSYMMCHPISEYTALFLKELYIESEGLISSYLCMHLVVTTHCFLVFLKLNVLFSFGLNYPWLTN